MQMNVQVGGSTFTAVLEENEAVDTLVEMMEQGPVTIQMSDYSGFEKVGSLGTSLPASNQQTTTQAGDIVLYQSNQIVMFYGSIEQYFSRLFLLSFPIVPIPPVLFLPFPRLSHP